MGLLTTNPSAHWSNVAENG